MADSSYLLLDLDLDWNYFEPKMFCSPKGSFFLEAFCQELWSFEKKKKSNLYHHISFDHKFCKDFKIWV